MNRDCAPEPDRVAREPPDAPIPIMWEDRDRDDVDCSTGAVDECDP
jgi:hypothetical protein